MALQVVQAGANLQLITDAGVVSAPLTIPAGVTLRTDIPPRWEVFNRYAVLVNTPSQPLIIDATGTVRLLTPKPPRLAPSLSGVTAGGLSGTYSGVRYTFVTKDANGNIISESDYSPASGSVTIVNKLLTASGLDISPDAISGRRIYRPQSGGAVLFQWVDLDGNVLTAVSDDLPDAALSIVGSPKLGTPPHLTLIAQFRGRLFGVGDLDVDHVRYTEAGVQYAWPAQNIIEIPNVGADQFGIVGLLPRRDALGVGRRNSLVQITGTGTETLDSNNNVIDIDFDRVVLSQELGIRSQESMKVFRDIAYFLWDDGVYAWSANGIRCISDGVAGKGQVRSWFTTNSYFNRDMFSQAFAVINPTHPYYRLFLASAGSNVIDSFVDYDIKDGTWWGPHRTDAFSPISAFQRTTDSDLVIPVIGGGVNLYNDQETRTDGASTAISCSAIGKRHALEVPDQEKYFGELSMLGKEQTGGHVNIISRIGVLDTTQTLTQYYDMRLNRQRLGRLGRGKHLQLELTNAEVGQDVQLFGYEIDPVQLIGRR